MGQNNFFLKVGWVSVKVKVGRDRKRDKRMPQTLASIKKQNFFPHSFLCIVFDIQIFTI